MDIGTGRFYVSLERWRLGLTPYTLRAAATWNEGNEVRSWDVSEEGSAVVCTATEANYDAQCAKGPHLHPFLDAAANAPKAQEFPTTHLAASVTAFRGPIAG